MDYRLKETWYEKHVHSIIRVYARHRCITISHFQNEMSINIKGLWTRVPGVNLLLKSLGKVCQSYRRQSDGCQELLNEMIISSSTWTGFNMSSHFIVVFGMSYNTTISTVCRNAYFLHACNTWKIYICPNVQYTTRAVMDPTMHFQCNEWTKSKITCNFQQILIYRKLDMYMQCNEVIWQQCSSCLKSVLWYTTCCFACYF